MTIPTMMIGQGPTCRQGWLCGRTCHSLRDKQQRVERARMLLHQQWARMLLHQQGQLQADQLVQVSCWASGASPDAGSSSICQCCLICEPAS
jgi:hypothetical protein